MNLVGFWFAAPNSFITQIHSRITEQDLTSGKPVLEYRKFREIVPPHCSGTFRIMTSKPTPSPQNVSMKQPCKHPRVQIVSRDEEAEFVECKECGEIFESSEFKDMNIEEQAKDADI
jgi:hypothetical protein